MQGKHMASGSFDTTLKIWGAKLQGSAHLIKVYSTLKRKLVRNLLLTLFQQFQQLVGRYCSCLLPRQDDGTSQIQVNGRFYRANGSPCRAKELN